MASTHAVRLATPEPGVMEGSGASAFCAVIAVIVFMSFRIRECRGTQIPKSRSGGCTISAVATFQLVVKGMMLDFFP